MGDEQQYQTNSGHGACEITRGGKRSDGVKMVEQICRQYPGIDSFCGSCVLAGISVESRGGEYHLVGKSHNLSTDELAKVMSFQKRFADAIKLSVIVETRRTFSRPIKSTGYRVAGGGAFPDPRLKQSVGDNKTDVRVLPAIGSVKHDQNISDGIEDKPVIPKGVPDNLLGDYSLDD